jgi:hypothetical protein
MGIKRLIYRAVPFIAVAGAVFAGTVGQAGAATVSSHQTPAATAAHRLPSLAAAEAYLKAHPATRAQIAEAKAYLAAHPLKLRVGYRNARGTHSPVRSGGLRPDVSVGVHWYGLDLYLTPTDTEVIWDGIFTAGLSAEGAALCAEGGPLAIVCGIIGGAVGYVIADAVYNWFDWGACGLDFYFNWVGGSSGVRYWDCH